MDGGSSAAQIDVLAVYHKMSKSGKPAGALLCMLLAGCAVSAGDSGRAPQRRMERSAAWPQWQQGRIPSSPRGSEEPLRPLPRTAERLPQPDPPRRQSAAPAVEPPTGATQPAPSTVTVCDFGGCRDNGGNRYNGGNGAFLDKNGRQCQRNGVWMQCF